MKDLYIIKLGGSAITKKSENKFEMNYSLLERIALEISEAKKQKDFNLIVVCGVGPFGHTNVSNFEINNGAFSADQIRGVEKTNSDCDFVGKETAKSFESKGMQTEFIPAYNICIQKARAVESYDFSQYEKALEEGKIPLTSGVMVKDIDLNWSVMSGDQAIAQLARYFKPKGVFLGTDVDGIYSSDPKTDANAELIEEINNSNISDILKKVTISKSVDVTGGMKGKLEKLSSTLQGSPGTIFNLFVENNLKNLLIGNSVKSTRILL